MTSPATFTVFATAIGPCGVAWGDEGLVAVQLPEANERATRSRLQRRVAGAGEGTPPADVRTAVAAIVALLDGERPDLSGIALDMSGVPEFHRQVYEVARTIGPGQTCTYGEVSVRIGEPGAARAVGQALGRNPFPIVVPCHRVVAAHGKLGGFSAHGGTTTKVRLLTIEGSLAPTLWDHQP